MMTSFDDNYFIDFNNLGINNIGDSSKSISKKIEYNFDKTTTETYRVIRELKLDPITLEKIPSSLEFKFEYMWDPITGDRLNKDPNGPFCFNVLTLTKNFYYNRLRMLWIDGETIDNIKYEGYYGDGVGAGEDLYVPSRGISKHMHLFRLPIIDCYLPKEFNYSIITMGPKLTDDEINQIQDIIDMHYKTKKNIRNKIDIKKIRDLYNIAINKSSTEKIARNAIDELRNMRY
jgi:hypothetical protein